MDLGGVFFSSETKAKLKQRVCDVFQQRCWIYVVFVRVLRVRATSDSRDVSRKWTSPQTNAKFPQDRGREGLRAGLLLSNTKYISFLR